MSCNGCGGTPTLLNQFMTQIQPPKKNPFSDKPQPLLTQFTNNGKFLKFTREKM